MATWPTPTPKESTRHRDGPAQITTRPPTPSGCGCARSSGLASTVVSSQLLTLFAPVEALGDVCGQFLHPPDLLRAEPVTV
jgi:hypothetical protein